MRLSSWGGNGGGWAGATATSNSRDGTNKTRKADRTTGRENKHSANPLERYLVAGQRRLSGWRGQRVRAGGCSRDFQLTGQHHPSKFISLFGQDRMTRFSMLDYCTRTGNHAPIDTMLFLNKFGLRPSIKFSPILCSAPMQCSPSNQLSMVEFKNQV